MRLIDRLNKYMELKGITAYAFEKTCGLANGYFGKQMRGKGSVGSDVLEKIGTQYPDLNLVWLITGKGKMLVKPPKNSIKNETDNLQVNDAEAVYIVRDKLIEVMKEQLAILSATGPVRKRRRKKTPPGK